MSGKYKLELIPTYRAMRAAKKEGIDPNDWIDRKSITLNKNGNAINDGRKLLDDRKFDADGNSLQDVAITDDTGKTIAIHPVDSDVENLHKAVIRVIRERDGKKIENKIERIFRL